MFWKVTCSRLCVSCLSYPNFVVYLNRSIPWAFQLYSVQNFAKCDCILIWQHHSYPSLPQSEHPIDKPFFPGLPTNPLLTGHPSSGPVRSHLQSINSKAAIIALFGPNRYRHPQFPRFLGASLSADYWWPIVWQAAQIMSSTVFCSSCHRDRWRGVLDNFLPTTLWTLSWIQWKLFLFLW